MSDADDAPCAPVLTVRADYGNATFLWRLDRPHKDGSDARGATDLDWDESLQRIEGNWQPLSDWPYEFDWTDLERERFDDDHLHWIAFHSRGLELARWIKEGVGGGCRVVYDRPAKGPAQRLSWRLEILGDGSLRSLPPNHTALHELPRFCERVVSGGQTGADRAALDFAIRHGYVHGGWAPRGREAEDGPIPLRYQLTELPEGGYRQRTRRNVEESDGTMILNLGELDGGMLATQGFARQLAKPNLVVPLDAGATGELVSSALAWLQAHRIHTLNVAGPRESRRPGIYRRTRAFLVRLDRAARRQPQGSSAQSCSEPTCLQDRD